MEIDPGFCFVCETTDQLGVILTQPTAASMQWEGKNDKSFVDIDNKLKSNLFLQHHFSQVN